VVGIGGAGIDYLASVGTFPEPDSKIRTDKLEKLGGGNCGNACTALARLGTHVRILSAVGDDVLGDNIVTEFEKDGVDTSFLHRDEGADTPFTYIIVDQLGVHTKSE
jgi:sugar/nucleoside kinase (ribokinase family)